MESKIIHIVLKLLDLPKLECFSFFNFTNIQCAPVIKYDSLPTLENPRIAKWISENLHIDSLQDYNKQCINRDYREFRQEDINPEIVKSIRFFKSNEKEVPEETRESYAISLAIRQCSKLQNITIEENCFNDSAEVNNSFVVDNCQQLESIFIMSLSFKNYSLSLESGLCDWILIGRLTFPS